MPADEVDIRRELITTSLGLQYKSGYTFRNVTSRWN